MTIAFESGYILPSSDLPLTHARILHAGNKHPIRKVIASDELTDYPGIAATMGETVDKWRPFENLLTEPRDFSDSDNWTPSGGTTIATDNQTLIEGTDNDTHGISQSYTFTPGGYIFSARVKLNGGRYRFRMTFTDGVSTFQGRFNSYDLVAVDGLDADGAGIVALGGNEYLLTVYAETVAAGVGDVTFLLEDDSAASVYTGDGVSGVQVLEVALHENEATLRYDLYEEEAASVFAIAAHNIGTGLGRITIEHDSNEDDTWTEIGVVTPLDDSPIMFFFVPVTSIRWRIKVDRSVLPEIGVMWIGEALQMERPFYGGYSRPVMSRNTTVRGNISGSGELLGRSKERTTLQASYAWNYLTYTWVDANLNGRNGLIQSIEAAPLFVAWRPSDTQDVDYVMRATADPPQNIGQGSLNSFSMSGEAHAYE